ncbi:MAG TPA: glycosyltransferase family 4 protein [Bryobacteraceae bacterium]|jgi:glycosyltransferase involved in cell wall biosynthesis
MIEEILDRLQNNPPKRGPFGGWGEEEAARRFQRFQHLRLGVDQLSSRALSLGKRVRVASTACWEFPIYSQTFVYQELAELARHGFDVRFLYSKLNPRSYLPPQFSRLWRAKRKLVLHYAVCDRDYAYYCERMPDKVERLVQLVCAASGMPPEELRSHYHFKQAFAFARTVEACRPDYLHSYFFYEGTFFTLVASYLLDIPRGVSCYADHMLDDYALKLVPLHLQQCSLVIATSKRIKRELIAIAPAVDPDRILVKPNAIDSKRFPPAPRAEPRAGQPYLLTCVSRIEPKKGILHLVEAVRLLLDRNLNVSVHVLGGVDDNDSGRNYAQSVETRIRELEVGHAVHLEGRRAGPEIRQFLEKSHLFVAPFVETESGDKDGIPTALLEAMASGLPAVATDAGSITEVIDDGQDGALVPQRDASALSEAIAALLADPERRQRMGGEAAAKVRRCFDVQVCEKAFHERIRMVTRIKGL